MKLDLSIIVKLATIADANSVSQIVIFGEERSAFPDVEINLQ